MFEPGDDFPEVIDGLRVITLTRPGSSVRTVVPHALRQAVRAREIGQSRGRYTAGDTVWHLPAAEAPDPPRPGDLILDAEQTRWTILDVRQTTGGTRWRCVARNLALFAGLDAYVDILKPSYEKGSGGADEVTWHLWKSGLRARIELVQGTVQERHQTDERLARFKILLEQDVPLEPGVRIRGADGTVYAVTAWRGAGRIDALMEIDAVETGKDEG